VNAIDKAAIRLGLWLLRGVGASEDLVQPQPHGSPQIIDECDR